MSKYYGTLQGSGTSTRCGSAKTGIKASVQSYQGSVTIRMRDDDSPEDGDGPCVSVFIDRSGSSTSGEWVFWGTIEELYEQLQKE